jgi:hypothetical protein
MGSVPTDDLVVFRYMIKPIMKEIKQVELWRSHMAVRGKVWA